MKRSARHSRPVTVDGGGYDATHAALAVGWLEELGREVADAVERHGRLVERTSTELVAVADVTDLTLEQSAVLHYLGGGAKMVGAAP